jgi:hypothetical protein
MGDVPHNIPHTRKYYWGLWKRRVYVSLSPQVGLRDKFVKSTVRNWGQVSRDRVVQFAVREILVGRCRGEVQFITEGVASPRVHEFDHDQASREDVGGEPATLRCWRCANSGPPFVRLTARSIKYDPKDIEEYIAERRVAPFGFSPRIGLPRRK